ncbi:hypothetical protein HDF10_002359 [Edaphobacter lichenicola]|uniref:Uncharacterized protein n=1 Tax=Tunturiibacter lichenicola TaxID=2051959 RepID=A0A7W8J883_9BACT|nr:hypothetical protein [Edaphobacter lichenicola]
MKGSNLVSDVLLILRKFHRKTVHLAENRPTQRA